MSARGPAPNGDPPDVLDAGRSGIHRPVAVVVVAAVVLLVVGWAAGWYDADGPAPTPAARSEAPNTTPVGDLGGPTGDRVESLRYADASTGFLVQWVCSLVGSSGGCPRRLLATEDGGRTWEPRGLLPEDARYLDQFEVVSPTQLAFFGSYLPATVAISTDGGRTFDLRALTRGGPLPAPAGAPVVDDAGTGCASPCSGELAWVDLASGRLHAVPASPGMQDTAQPRLAARPATGDLAVAGSRPTGASVSISLDGGSTWRRNDIDVALGAEQSMGGTTVYAAGDGRVFLFLEVNDSTGVAEIYGYRTDDAGRTWQPTGFETEDLWLPAGVLGAELVTTDNPGDIYLSSGGGVSWAVGGPLPGPAYLEQTGVDGPVLATLIDRSGRETYYQSTDGRLWTVIVLPGGG